VNMQRWPGLRRMVHFKNGTDTGCVFRPCPSDHVLLSNSKGFHKRIMTGLSVT
jgi:hypothetical protein